MRLAKQHKMYGAILGLAVAALGADRAFFTTSPAETAESFAVAKSDQAPAAAAPQKRAVAVAPAKAADAAAADDRRAVSARLDELARTAGFSVASVHDAFTPPSAWLAAETSANAADPAQDERVRRFAADHRLTAVMGSDTRHAVAIIDGKPFKPGQTLDGFTLVSVSARDSKAVFQRNGTPVELRLKKEVTGTTVAQAN